MLVMKLFKQVSQNTIKNNDNPYYLIRFKIAPFVVYTLLIGNKWSLIAPIQPTSYQKYRFFCS